MSKPKTKHPAKYSDQLLPVFASMLKGNEKLLDPFAGTGKIYSLLQWHPNLQIEAVEIEPEWAALDERITLGDALNLNWDDGFFDAILTSPTYGNRMADSLRTPENWKREYHYITYAQYLNRKLNKNNSGSLQWGEKYKEFHLQAWVESRRVLKKNGTFILNIKNHIRAGKEQKVTQWHVAALKSLGFIEVERRRVRTLAMRKGSNSNLRIPFENVIKFVLKNP